MSAKRWHFLLGILVSMAPVASGRQALAAMDQDEAAEASAQVKNHGMPWRTLAERIPSVTHRAFSKSGRTELFGQLGLSLSDPFFRYVAPGVGARYHFDESWAVGAFVDYDAAIRTAIDIVSVANTEAVPDLNHPNLGVGLEAVYAPIYGKISWMAERVAHFDMYLSVGVGFLALHHASAVAGTFAIGQHYFLTSNTALKIELREQLYGMARDPAASPHDSLTSLLMAQVGVSFFVPDANAFAQP